MADFFYGHNNLCDVLPCFVYEVLRHTPSCHFVFDVTESRVVLAQVVRHVSVGVDAQQFGAGIYQELHQV